VPIFATRLHAEFCNGNRNFSIAQGCKIVSIAVAVSGVLRWVATRAIAAATIVTRAMLLAAPSVACKDDP
jgi:hypothetical protein